jgi:adenine-specific DNA-methyltransferase
LAKIEITKTELVWPGKYDEDGTRREVPRVNLPFQVIETVNESRATREANQGPQQNALFDIYRGTEGDTFGEGWKNKLVWGDSLLIMSSLLDKFAGKIDLIYIDPPFATGADFSFAKRIGDAEVDVEKEQSAIEEKAYRDTWGRGLDSYLDWFYKSADLLRALSSKDGSIYVHLDWHVGHYAKVVLDEVLGEHNFKNEIIWKRSLPHNDPKKYGSIHDVILFYVRSEDYLFTQQFTGLSDEYKESHYGQVDKEGRRYQLTSLAASGPGPARKFGERVIEPPRGNHWRYSQERIDALISAGRITFTKEGKPRYIRYMDEMKGPALQSIWTDVYPVNSQATERLDYPTQKPEALLTRLIETSSLPGNLILDCFCGSGTTLAAAEKMGRRWIGCDLGRYAVHTTRKRMLGIQNCKPFEILNLGKYERQYWQGVNFEGKGRSINEKALYEYLAFILKLYGAQPVAGLAQLHGKKGRAMVHIGAVDAPITIDEINAAISECSQLKQSELHLLGWEWEMGVNDLMVPEAKKQGIKLLLLQIPREVMEQQAADKGDIEFFELAYLEVEIEKPKKLTVFIKLKAFIIPNTELIPEEVRSKVKKWSDYIDYWAIDWDFQNDTFMQGWVNYRTRRDRSLALVSDQHIYEKAGTYRVLVKVVDIFGNDTTQAFDVNVK